MLRLFKPKRVQIERTSDDDFNFIIENYVDLYEVEKQTKVRVDTLRKWARQGKLKTIRVGGKQGPHLVHSSTLKELLERQEKGLN